ncbi:MAG: PH domain-containing protein [Acidimicrobiales bacterium]|nr:PH domain-containing protein [Acidimicrobiales bacterium]
MQPVPPLPPPALLDGTPQRLDPRVRVVWAAGSALPLLAVTVAAVVVLSLVGAPGLLTAGVGLLGVVGVVLAAVLAVLEWRTWCWSAWDDALELTHGVVVRHASLVPYHRIQQIDVERGPVERALGLSSLVLRTAAATTDARLPGIPAEHADALRRLLLVRAGVDDAV